MLPASVGKFIGELLAPIITPIIREVVFSMIDSKGVISKPNKELQDEVDKSKNDHDDPAGLFSGGTD